MKVLITGADGQLGQALISSIPKDLRNNNVEVIATTRKELDLSQPRDCKAKIHKLKPDWLLNSGAYTKVDEAESESKLAMTVNGETPRAFAEALRTTGGQMLQLSTDFVFNGEQGNPYQPQHSRQPLNVYGHSKAAGEKAVEEVLGPTNQGTILRTSWLMGPVGHNFALNLLDLHKAKDELRIVADQVASPTSSITLSTACWQLIKLHQKGISTPSLLHWCDSGVASWYDVAVAIGEIGKKIGLIENPARVIPITTNEFPRPAKRPKYSILECSSSRLALQLEPVYWRTALEHVLKMHFIQHTHL